ncbi:hypothetical protein EJ08DRAFT_654574 [Tothia fuscella]|uniref:DNA damage-binding protein 1 n=1 Tax=Tothia fuscella TaxID=1048955 RepID=A0A9P4NEB3_9PEZI|nr:hypothetical protein EJ08DRAFT_654574 [Tothia fuscella]
MQCYTELTPPTAVTHSVNLPFLSAKANNLVVARTSVLQIFELKTISTEAAANDDSQTVPDGLATETMDNFDTDYAVQRMEQTCKLVLVSEYNLSGTILSLKRVKTLNTRSGGDSLLVAFKEAKLSLVEWDPGTFAISTISVHYYEGESLQACPWAPEIGLCRNYLTVDPDSRCAALKFGQRHLAILPFRQLADGLGDEDFDADMEDADDRLALQRTNTNGDSLAVGQTPYTSSFVLSMTMLDPALTHPIHLAFLHEYREPTFGIMSSARSLGSALLYERKDTVNYTVFTLDIEQRASTTILSITGLPNDLYEVVPLPLPVGGALLLGTNDLVHVDEAGKTNALAVNEFAKQVSSYGMADQSSLGLRLEGCAVQMLGESGDVLIVLKTGELAILSFTLEGRSVLGLQMHKVAAERGGSILATGASSVSNLGRGRVFLGNSEADAVVLGWTKKAAQLTRKRSHADMTGDVAEVSDDDFDLDDDDDIYGDDEPVATSTSRSSQPESSGGPDSYIFRIHDRLPNFAPVGDVTVGDPFASRSDIKAVPLRDETVAQLELVYPSGRGTAGGITILKREIDPLVNLRTDIPRAKAIWSLHPKEAAAKGMEQVEDTQLSVHAEFDDYIIVSWLSEEGNEESALYSVTPKGLIPVEKEDFDPEAGATIEAGTMARGTRIVQVLREEIKCFDAEFNMEQIIPAADDTTGAELKFIGASFCDPYLLLLRDDSSITIFQASATGELEELERGDGILSSQWLSASVYKSPATYDKALAFCLTAEGGLRIFELPNLEDAVYSSDGLSFVLPTLTEDAVPRRNATKESLTEIVVADLGDETAKSPYLIVRTSNDDLIIYEPFHLPADTRGQSFTTNLRWRKISQPRLAKYSEESELESVTSGRESLLRRIDNIGGYSTVFQAGTSPCFVLKEASSSPRVVALRGKAVRGLSGFHTAKYDRGFAYVDVDGVGRMCQLPPQARYGDTGWVTRRVDLKEEVQYMQYFAQKEVYAIATNERVEFKLPEDDYHQEWAREETTFLPSVDQGTIKLLYPLDWSIIDTYHVEQNEVVLSMEVINLEVSEVTHKRKPLLCVGTAIIQGEDLPTKGHIYIFDVINVVPEPDQPKTSRKLKLVAREEVKGAVSAISEIGSEGFLLMAQGQKCMVRGLKEDGTLLPVAFLDVQTYVTVAKALKGTGMCLMGDAAKGVWFTGYTEEPYRMAMFGKGRSRMDVVSAEFLPYGKLLFILVADGDCNLHVLQYDPEHPKSLQGQHLLHKSTFHLGHFPISLTRLPSTLTPPAPETDIEGDTEIETPQTQSQILVTTQTGTIGLLTALTETQYRRLGALQTYLTNQLDNHAGLNPKGYRVVDGERFGSRGVIDGTLLSRWSELSSQRRVEALGKVGVEEWVIRSDVEAVGGGGLGFL